jgi:hypothetical protein
MGVCAFVALGGFLGLVNFPSYDSPTFHASTEVVFLGGLLTYFAIYDIILTFLSKPLGVFVIIHDIAIGFAAAALISARLWSMFSPFVVEYVAYAVVFLKFPVLGWQLFGPRDFGDAHKRK